MSTTNDAFYNDPNYEPPKGTDYMKFQAGENKFRILSSPIMGYIDWKDKKPHRTKEKQPPLDPANGSPKHFWGLVVWDYQEKRITVLEIDKQTVIKAIDGLVRQEAWGDPRGYDLTVSRAGTDFNTTYTTTPLPKTEISKEITAALEELPPINLDALWEGGDPFAKEGEEKKEAATSEAAPAAEPAKETTGPTDPKPSF